MKNLNRKLSVIALSGMAVFGGVAASAVPAFAAGNKVAVVEQEVKDKAVEEVQKLIREAGYGGIYEAVESGNRRELLKEAEKISKAKGFKHFSRGVRSINQKKPVKSLERILGQRQDALVVKWKDNFVLIVDVIHD